MCGIDPGELTPFQGGPFAWPVPGVETPGCILQSLRDKKPSQIPRSLSAIWLSPFPDY
jgi:hypothetical protein